MKNIKTDLKRLDAMTDEEIRKAVEKDSDAAPLADSLEGFKRHRGLQKYPTKVAISIRLSAEVVEHFRSQGPGWQSRIDEALKEIVEKETGNQHSSN